MSFPILGLATVERVRRSATSRVNGRVQSPTEDITAFKAYLEPANARHMRESGASGRDGLIVVTRLDLRSSKEGSHLADQVIYNNERYEVLDSQRLMPFIGEKGGHWEVTCARVVQPSVQP